ncbi:acyltransferase [Clostridium sp.]|uniref:acyltransferase n=1 Tax=Clostridium sp. TaxID=1506 RepID=UPI002FC943D6
MENKKSYGMVNIIKLICAIMVVMIHTSALKDINTDLYVTTSLGITRVAVPFFFIVSGYFNYKAYKDKLKWRELLKKYIKWYFMWILIEMITLFPMTVFILKEGIVFGIVRILMVGVSGSLWYVSALIISTAFIYPFVKKEKYILLSIISIFLFVLGLAGDSYYKIFEGTIMGNLAVAYLSVFIMMQTCITMGVPFLTIGVIINKYNLKDKFKSSKVPLTITIIGVILLAVEAITLYKNQIPIEYNFYISTLIAAPFALIYGLKSKARISSDISILCGELSIGIYLTHQIIMMWGYNIIGWAFKYCLVKFLVTLVLATIIAYVIRSNKSTRKLIMK